MPKTESKQITFRFDKSFYDDLKTVSTITGKSMTEIVETAVTTALNYYRGSAGKVIPIPAYRLSGLTEYEKRIAVNEGKEEPIEKHECFILDEVTMMFDKPYYLIYDKDNKNIMKVPKDHIEFISKEV